MKKVSLVVTVLCFMLLGCSQKAPETTITEASEEKQEIVAEIEEEQDDAEAVFDHLIELDRENDQELVEIIKEDMAAVAPSTHGPARYTVYVENLNQPQKKAYVSNWLPANAQFSASTIKVFVMITAYQQFESGQLKPDATYELAEEDLVEGSGVLLSQPLGTKYTLKEVCQYMIEDSDNTATNVMIDQVGGFDSVNQTIAGLVGQDHYTSLERKLMDIDQLEDGKANRINAKEAVQVLFKLYQGKVINPALDRQMLNLMLNTSNQTKLPAILPEGAVCYNKSGESDFRGIENDLALIEYQGEVFGICVLTEMEGDGEEPETSTIDQQLSQIEAIALLGNDVTQWMVKDQ